MTDQGNVFEPASAAPSLSGDLLGVVAEIYSAVSQPGAWPGVLNLLAPCFGTTKGLITFIDALHPSATESLLVGVDDRVATAFATRDLANDLVFNACRKLAPESVAIGSELVASELVLAHPAWPPFRSAGLDYQLVAVLENRVDMCAIVGVARSDRDFTPAEKHWLQRLVTHLRLALSFERRLQRAEAGRREMRRWFESARQPCVMLDRSGYALLVNAAAQSILDRADGMAIKFGRFLFDEVTTQTRFETAVRTALDASAPVNGASRSDIRVNRASGRPPIELGVIPVRRPSDQALMPEGTSCIVVINDPATPQTVAPERLVRLYGLTASEARVCEALLTTGAVIEAAESLHITANTARSHLKSVFDKVGVANQAQLMQRLTLLARQVTPADVFGAGIPGER